MSAWLQRNPLIVVLAVAALVLAAVLAFEFGVGARPQVPEGGRKVTPAEPRLFPPLAAVLPEQAYPETANRPLFAPTRRPAPVAPAAAAQTMARGQYVLQGVIVAGDNRIALLREKSSGRIHRVEKGRELTGGVRVAKIDHEAVTLAQGGEQEVLPLLVQRASAAGPVAAPAAAASAQPGPFGPLAPAAVATTPGGIAPTPHAPGVGSTSPFPQGSPPVATTAPGQPPPPGAPTSAITNPMSPEELLARRRARRVQQNQ